MHCYKKRSRIKMKILLLIKKTEHCKKIRDFVRRKFPEPAIFEGDVGDPPPKFNWKGDYIISFLSPWIVPESLLNKAKISINFHPAPPKYPGIGCYNFAIYNQDKEYGVTCHHMLPKVDTGKVIKIRKFQMYETDTIFSLKERTMKHLIKLFYDIFEDMIQNKPLPTSEEQWSRKPYTRKDFQELCRVTRDMDDGEIKRRIRATYFPGAIDLPYIEIAGNKFILKNEPTYKK